MTLPNIDLLRSALGAPSSLLELGAADWDLLIRQARAADLLGRVAAGCIRDGVLESIPAQPRMHITSAARTVERQQKELLFEITMIKEALMAVGLPVILLKGAAYVARGLQAAEGRLVSDVDVLVPRYALVDVESALMKKGWISAAKSGYDQRYYRTWMHELPPMKHLKRGTVIDVHHAILPLTSRLRPSSENLLVSARPAGNDDMVRVLSPEDMVLHSASHLFHEGEFDHGLRDLVDIDSLLREFGFEASFWLNLVPRARVLDLVLPLQYALRYAKLLLRTPIPEPVWSELRSSPGARKSGLLLSYLDGLFLRALLPDHSSLKDRYSTLARWQLYLRGHWLRMPPGLLLRHLIHKAFLRAAPSEA